MISHASIFILAALVLAAISTWLVVQRKLSAIPCLLVFTSIFPVEMALERSAVARGEQRAEFVARSDLNYLVQRLTGQIDAHLAAVNGLATYVSVNPQLTQAEFDRFAAAIKARQDHIVSIATAPGLVVDKVFPLQGNEVVLGLNYLDTSDQRSAVLRARDTRKPVLAGPVRLVQGVDALVARLPVYVTHADGAADFWGIVSATLDAGKVFASASLGRTDDSVDIAIRGVDGEGGRGEVFYGDPELFDRDEIILFPVPIASGNWLVAAEFAKHAGLSPAVWFLRITALLLAVIWLLALYQRHEAARNAAYYQRQLRARKQLMHEAGKLAGVAGWRLDEHSEVVHFSAEFGKIVGLDNIETVARERVLSLLSPADRERIVHAVTSAFKHATPYELELSIERDGKTLWLRIIGNPVIKGEKVVELVGAVQDVTERREFVQTIERQTTLDELTGLPNRTQLDRVLAQCIAEAAHKAQRLAVLFVDLDGFKSVNDNMGHSSGDALLREAAGRIQACARSCDVVARLTADEFAVILPDIVSRSVASVIAAKIVAAINQPFEIGGHQIFVSGSVGVAVYPEDGGSAEVLLINADQAMSEVKKSIRNDFMFFTRELHQRSENRHQLFNKLSLAIAEQRLEVHYQPIVPIDGRGQLSCEALVRWRDGDQFIPPDAFIPLAEETGLITEIDRMVMQTATEFVESLGGEGWDKPALSVNVSPRIFFDRAGELTRWIEHVKHCSTRASLTIEMTERLLTQDTPHASGVLQQLRDVGVNVAIDDFGTGYSSLSYLAKFPIDTLKVDAFFVSRVPDDPAMVTLTESIMWLGRKLSLALVAEGVETPEQLRFLKESGCHFAQGYGLSKPLPPDEFRDWVHAYRASQNNHHGISKIGRRSI